MFEYTNEAHVFVMFLVTLLENFFIVFCYSVILFFSINEYITQDIEFINSWKHLEQYKKYIIVPFQIMYFLTIICIILFGLLFTYKLEYKFMFY